MYIRKSTRSYRGKTYTNHRLVESVQTPKGPRQRTVCSLGDLSPRPRKEWLKLACKIEDALVGQGDLLDPDDGEVADIVRRVRARRARGHGDRGVNDETLPAPPQGSSGGLIKVDPTRVTTERHREAGPVHVGHQFWRRLGLDDILGVDFEALEEDPLDSGAKRNALKRSRFERPFQARQSRLGMAS